MLKAYRSYYKRVNNYFQKHPDYNSIIHVIGGIGIGILIAYPVAFPHPVRWGLILIAVSIAGHFYASTLKK